MTQTEKYKNDKSLLTQAKLSVPPSGMRCPNVAAVEGSEIIGTDSWRSLWRKPIKAETHGVAFKKPDSHS